MSSVQKQCALAMTAKRSNPPVCKFFLEGGCKFGIKCRNNHPGGKEKIRTQLQGNGKQPTETPKRNTVTIKQLPHGHGHGTYRRTQRPVSGDDLLSKYTKLCKSQQGNTNSPDGTIFVVHVTELCESQGW